MDGVQLSTTLRVDGESTFYRTVTLAEGAKVCKPLKRFSSFQFSLGDFALFESGQAVKFIGCIGALFQNDSGRFVRCNWVRSF